MASGTTDSYNLPSVCRLRKPYLFYPFHVYRMDFRVSFFSVKRIRKEWHGKVFRMQRITDAKHGVEQSGTEPNIV